MNRIILIGNGFDLAHGMKTDYNSFIDHLWKKIISEIKNVPLNKPLNSSEIDLRIRFEIPENLNSHEELKNHIENQKLGKIHYKNQFLGEITHKKSLQNWVDIENEYYDRVKTLVNKNNRSGHISILNSDFIGIRNRLVEYLINEMKNFHIKSIDTDLLSDIREKIYSPFKFVDFTQSYINSRVEYEYSNIIDEFYAVKTNKTHINVYSGFRKKLLEMLLKEGDEIKNSIRKFLISESSCIYFDVVPEEILFLNFNYTSTENLYSSPKTIDSLLNSKPQKVNTIHIHGEINDIEKNPLIFGYGDEIGSDYRNIENFNDNRFLENIKSINYLETNNYKRLLEFADNDKYQIYIFGHSCGLSDRTLLNTLFEHQNCVSIKPFYHQKSSENDNYKDIVRNISRNFNDKALMRDKVVNKQYCKPLRKLLELNQ